MVLLLAQSNSIYRLNKVFVSYLDRQNLLIFIFLEPNLDLYMSNAFSSTIRVTNEIDIVE